MNTNDSCAPRNTESAPPGANSADARDAAQAHANEIANQFVSASHATHAERAVLVERLKAAVAEVARLEAGGA